VIIKLEKIGKVGGKITRANNEGENEPKEKNECSAFGGSEFVQGTHFSWQARIPAPLRGEHQASGAWPKIWWGGGFERSQRQVVWRAVSRNARGGLVQLKEIVMKTSKKVSPMWLTGNEKEKFIYMGYPKRGKKRNPYKPKTEHNTAQSQ